MNTILIIISLIFLCSIIPIVYLNRKYSNPYRLYMVFGKKGSGKTTYMAKLSCFYAKKHVPVYSTVHIPGTIYIPDISMLGRYTPPYGSVLLVDEVGMIWDNRNFKNFRTDVRDWFKLQRHYGVTVYLFSQTFDIDIKLRNLTDAMYLVTAPFPFLSVVRRIKRTVVLTQPDNESEGRIADSLEFVPLLMALFGAKPFQLTWIPRYAKMFNTTERPHLPEFSGQPDPIPKKLKKMKKNRKKSKIYWTILKKFAIIYSRWKR